MPDQRRSSAVPVERARDQAPEDPSWRADALARSRHSRLLEELRQPVADDDPDRAEALCSEVARHTLLDFAAALILLPVIERRRCQVLTAHALTLFDFALQTGLEGERLSQINRWEFELEATLTGTPASQPIFVQMARAEREGAWPRQALDSVTAAARRRVMVPTPRDTEALAIESRALGAALAGALLGESGESVQDLAEGLVRLGSLLGLHEALRRGRPRLSLPGSPLEDRPEAARQRALTEAVREECRLVRPLLEKPPGAVPPVYRRAVRYAALAGRRLLRRIERDPGHLAEGPPTLGAFTRIGLLLRAASPW